MKNFGKGYGRVAAVHARERARTQSPNRGRLRAGVLRIVAVAFLAVLGVGVASPAWAAPSVIATIPLPSVNGVGAHSLAVSPDGTKVYVTADRDWLYVINVADSVVGSPIQVGNDVRGVAFRPDGSEAFTVDEGGYLSRIDAVNDLWIDGNYTYAYTRSIAFSADGLRAYATIGTCPGSLLGGLNGVIPVGCSPAGVAFTPNSERAYVTNRGDNTVTVINVADDTFVGSITVGSLPEGVAITPDGAKAYVVNSGDNTVTVINVADNMVLGLIQVGAGPLQVAISPDGTTAYVTNGNDGTVTVINVADNTVVGPPIQVGQFPRGVAFTPDGTKAYVANGWVGGVPSVTVIATGLGAAPAPAPAGLLAATGANAPGLLAFAAAFTVVGVGIATGARLRIIRQR